MSDTVIQVENLSKRYRLGEREPYKALRDIIASGVSAPFRRLTHRQEGKHQANPEYIWALRDVSFEVKQGEIVGIIGRNGAGKTTLLKVLSRVTEPTKGWAKVWGRVGSLLEVATGFHPELTGGENIYLNGAILGMKKTEIVRKFNDIVDFAEIGDFLDTPVKHYSQGMYVRLAFSVAAHFEPEILFIDEVLAVGDAAFQQKCLGKMEDVARGGRTVLFVSHNLAAVTNLCSVVYLLDEGQVVTSGLPQPVIEKYLATVRPSHAVSLRQRQDRSGDGRMRFTDLVIQDSKGNPISVATSGQDIEISVGYEASDNQPLQKVRVSIVFHDLFEQVLVYCRNDLTGELFKTLSPRGRIVCHIPHLPFYPGRYNFNLHAEVNGIVADWLQPGGTLEVAGGDFYGTGRLPPESHRSFLVPHSWTANESKIDSVVNGNE